MPHSYWGKTAVTRGSAAVIIFQPAKGILNAHVGSQQQANLGHARQP